MFFFTKNPSNMHVDLTMHHFNSWLAFVFSYFSHGAKKGQENLKKNAKESSSLSTTVVKHENKIGIKITNAITFLPVNNKDEYALGPSLKTMKKENIFLFYLERGKSTFPTIHTLEFLVH